MIEDSRAAQILSGESITTEEAVSLFANLAASYTGTLNDHLILQAAVARLRDAVIPATEDAPSNVET